MRKPHDFADYPAALKPLASFGPFRAAIIHVVDGDTYDATFDAGLNVYPYRTIRLKDVNCPERNTEAGRAAQIYVRALLPPGTHCVVTTYKDQLTFGRYVATVQFVTEFGVQDLAAHLVEAGHAVRVR